MRQALTRVSIECKFSFEADTPEDAAAKLAIELFRQDLLVKESGGVRA